MIIICHQFVNISIRELRVMGSVIWKMINVFVEGILIKWTSNSAVKCVLIFVKMCRLRLYLVTCLACVSIVMDLTDKFNFIRFRLTLLGLGFVHFSACLLLWLPCTNESHPVLWQIYFSFNTFFFEIYNGYSKTSKWTSYQNKKVEENWIRKLN